MKNAKAFSPSHITGVFQIFDQAENALYVGSKGFGVSLSRGVETVVKIEKTEENSLEVKINGLTSDSAEVSHHVVNEFLSRFSEMENFRIAVHHNVDVPIGAGFGTSGAAALSLALALNKVFDLGMSKIDVAQLAHVAEVECKTGLGTVIAEALGGVEVRVKPGAPGIGEIRHLKIPKDVVVACLAFGSMLTSKFLADEEARGRINELGGHLISELIEKPYVANFMKLSRQFAEHVGLMSDRIKQVLKAADATGCICSMAMFGESVFTLTESGSLGKVLRVFREYRSAGKIIVSDIDFEGARTLN